MGRKSDVENDFRLYIDSRIQPNLLFFAELNLLLINSYTIRVGSKLLVVVFGVGLIPVLNGRSGSADAEPLAEITAFRGCHTTVLNTHYSRDQL